MKTTPDTAARKAAADRARVIACCAAYDAASAARRGDDEAARRHAGIAQAAADTAPAGMADSRHAASFAVDAARWHGRSEHARQTARGMALEAEAEIARRQEEAALAAVDAYEAGLSKRRNDEAARGMDEADARRAAAALAVLQAEAAFAAEIEHDDTPANGPALEAAVVVLLQAAARLDAAWPLWTARWPRLAFLVHVERDIACDTGLAF